ncbi:LysR family transcriptional regulator [Streptomyces sp. NPDC002746]
MRRLRTFLQVAGYRSLGDACAALGLPPHSVTAHLNRLEEELGGPLLVRTLKNRPMEPTELGHQVLAAPLPLAKHLGVPPEALPAQLPTPRQARRRKPRTTTAARLEQFPLLLRPAAGTKGGRRRLRRFLEAARYSSLVAFARDVGLDPSVVTLQIRLLERDLDGELLIRGGNAHPMRLTGLGQKVLAAAQPHAAQLGDLYGPRRRTRNWSPGPAVHPNRLVEIARSDCGSRVGSGS